MLPLALVIKKASPLSSAPLVLCLLLALRLAPTEAMQTLDLPRWKALSQLSKLVRRESEFAAWYVVIMLPEDAADVIIESRVLLYVVSWLHRPCELRSKKIYRPA
jgi:hypothetical protein